MLCILLVKRRF